MTINGACNTPQKTSFTPQLKQKAPVSVFSTAAVVRLARARFAAQLGDQKRAQRELSLAADQASKDNYLQAAWRALLESR